MDWIRVVVLCWFNDINKVDLSDIPIVWVMLLTPLMLSLWNVVVV